MALRNHLRRDQTSIPRQHSSLGSRALHSTRWNLWSKTRVHVSQTPTRTSLPRIQISSYSHPGTTSMNASPRANEPKRQTTSGRTAQLKSTRERDLQERLYKRTDRGKQRLSTIRSQAYSSYPRPPPRALSYPDFLPNITSHTSPHNRTEHASPSNT